MKTKRSSALVLTFVSASLIACVYQGDETRQTPTSADYATAGVTTYDGPEDPHADMIRASGLFPSARQCAPCHGQIFDEWRSSAHAYSGISPMFHKFEQKLNDLAVGTVNAFCVRCHLPVGTAIGQPREMTLYDRELDHDRFKDHPELIEHFAPGHTDTDWDPYVVLEGVTCIACHRVSEQYGRVNGQRRIEPGTVFDHMYGTRAGEALDTAKADSLVAASKAEWDEATKAGDKKLAIHGSVVTASTMNKSEFCMSCHQVAVHPGIKLEVVWDQYLDSPACDQGATCQDCHMGKEPGKWYAENNYNLYPRANVGGVNEITHPSDPNGLVEHKDHSFVGPGYSIAHPGIFPHNATALTFETINRPGSGSRVLLEDWLQFNWTSQWGYPEFEANLDPNDGTDFGVWSNANDRINARTRITENLALLDERQIRRQKVMENASHIDGPFFDSTPKAGRALKLHYDVKNICEGHNLPSGSLGAQPQLWLNVVLVDPDGERVWESGYVDSTGDMADLHSQEVLDGKLEHDDQLFNLQSKFLTTNIKGTDREMYLPVNIDVDQIPFIRPAGVPSTVLNHPPFIRMEQHSIPPLMTKKAKYKVPASAMTKKGTYKIAVRLRSRAEPIYFMKFVGSTDDMITRMNDRMGNIHEYTASFEVR